MKTNSQPGAAGQSRAHQLITERIIALLQAGTVPWQKPWASTGTGGLPKNLLTGRPYRGVNVFLLAAMPYASAYWLSFKQALALGGNVRKGEKSTPVVFWKWLEADELDAQGKKKRVPLLRYYSAFNVEQCEGIKTPEAPAPTRVHSPIEAAEQIVAAMPKRPEIQHRGTQALYSPGLDVVRMPAPETFTSAEHYYGTLFHELTHATGHESRLNRKGVARTAGEWNAFGSAPYAREELVAEMGAAFLSGHVGIVDRIIDNSAAYLAAWLERLREDSRLIVTAAAQAQKAADYILNIQLTETAEDAQ